MNLINLKWRLLLLLHNKVSKERMNKIIRGKEWHHGKSVISDLFCDRYCAI